MTTSIGPNPLAQAAATQPVMNQVDSTTSKHSIAQSKEDIVEISKTAQARSLKQQGQTVPQIALDLGLDAKTVTSYLRSGIVPQQVATIAPQVKQAATTEPQVGGSTEEATESGAAKATELLQGKNDLKI